MMGATELFGLALLAYFISAVLPLSTPRWTEAASAIASSIGSAAGIGAAIIAILTNRVAFISMPWRIPGGMIVLRIDALAGIFLLVIFSVAGLASVYGFWYWPAREHPRTARQLRCLFALMTIGMAVVVSAAQTILFLVAWEVMAIAAFFLVATDDDAPSVRRAAWVYLIATHIGTACLFAAFALLHTLNGNYLLQRPTSAASTSVVFVLALIGFGLKAGLVPLHFWLPAAHASAPSHVSALMSGVMLKMGIYGLLRIATLDTTPPVWWGVLLATLGALSAVLGIALAAGQSDLKRALAYSSIENVGIITLGLGLALVGRAAQQPLWVVLGFAGSLYHVLSHAAFKSLLFLASGNVAHATHTRDMDTLGGLLHRMPYTGNLFIIGALAASGVPLLNGFIGEWLIGLGLLQTLGHSSLLVFALPALALAAAIALASFVRLTGATFLGTPRTTAAADAHEAEAGMLAPMLILALVCVALGVWPTALTPLIDAPLRAWLDAPINSVRDYLVLPLRGLALLAAVAGLVSLGLTILIRRQRRSITWDCGYARPTARMQYTARSFGEWVTALIPAPLAPQVVAVLPKEIFPATASIESNAPDPFTTRVYEPLVQRVASRFERVRRFQQGRLTLYLVYIFITTVLALTWAYVRQLL